MPFSQGSSRTCTSWHKPCGCKTRQDASTHSGEDGGVAASHTALGVPGDTKKTASSPSSSSNPNLSISMAGGTLPIPKMQRVKRRAQAHLVFAALLHRQLLVPNKKQQPAGLQERAGTIKTPFILRHSCSFASQLESYTTKLPRLDILGSLCLLSQCLIIQAGPESLSLVPSTWQQGRSHHSCHGVLLKHLLSPQTSEHSSPSLGHLEGLKVQPVQRKAQILTHQDQCFSTQELWAVQLPHIGKGQEFYCPEGN